MKVMLANPRGFCAGVNGAIATVNAALSHYGSPIYVFHEIVHNKLVVQGFIERGVIFVDDVNQVPPGNCLIFSAHGISPLIRQQAERRNLRVIDATCPLVAKVHQEAVFFASNGFEIILIGHPDHDEIVGTIGEAPSRIHVVAKLEDVNGLNFPPDTPLAYLTQTTLSVDETKEIIEALKLHFPSIVGPASSDICYASQNRQEAVKQLARDAELVLVFGSRNSSNSRRLVELATKMGRKAYLVDLLDEIKDEWFEGVERLLISAGASTPESIVTLCVMRLKEKYKASVEEYPGKIEPAFFS